MNLKVICISHAYTDMILKEPSKKTVFPLDAVGTYWAK